jgi:uncharacterized membrane protein YidH (DUF202 family)
MKPSGIVGIVLIIFGVLALAYGGFSFTTQEKKKVVDLGPLQVDATVERERSLPLPPILGVAALAGGVVLVIVGRKK